mgnify:CR=1 FL=1
MPKYYPICLDIARLPCLVVGGGAVGLRKVRTLLAHGARATVVAPLATRALERLARQGRICLRRRGYRTSDLKGVRLAFVATDDAALNRRVASDARQHGLFVNVVDDPELCDFIVPSIVRRSQLLLAVSTGGSCPAYSKRLRQQLEKQFDPAYGHYVQLLGGMRRLIQQRVKDQARAVKLLEQLLGVDLLNVIRKKGRAAAEARARALVERWLQCR